MAPKAQEILERGGSVPYHLRKLAPLRKDPPYRDEVSAGVPPETRLKSAGRWEDHVPPRDRAIGARNDRGSARGSIEAGGSPLLGQRRRVVGSSNSPWHHGSLEHGERVKTDRVKERGRDRDREKENRE
ncbi:hypothetical protein KM043_005176 [Ampulex compressa]|nr:hypothetical protein KM043_005176 [Ampulex compressa]